MAKGGTSSERKGGTDASIREVRTALADLRTRARTLLIARRASLGIAWVVCALLVFGSSDYLLRYPAFLRTGLLLAGLVVATLWFRRVLLPAIRFAPTLADLALRVEKILPEYKGMLASAVDFTNAENVNMSEIERGLIARSVRESGLIAERVGGVRASALDRKSVV